MAPLFSPVFMPPLKERGIKVEDFLSYLVIVIFCAAATLSAFVIIEENNNHGVTADEVEIHLRLFFSIVAMGISGLGLIALLVQKIKSLEQANLRTRDALNLLAPRMAAIEAAGEGIAMVDEGGNVVYCNKSFLMLHGIPPGEKNFPSGDMLKNFYPEKERLDFVENVLSILEKEGLWRGERSVLRQDGGVSFAEVSLSRLPEGGFIVTARDIGDKKKAEEEKENLQKQFFQAQKMEAVGRLAGGIAHDFNNILASIMGYAEFLLDDLDVKSKEHHFVRQIMHGSIQARHLIEQILAFSRRNEGAQDVVDVAQTVREVVAMLRATMPATVRIDTQVDVDAGRVKGNHTQISQILMNLCVNARDAMENDEGNIKIVIYKQGIDDQEIFGGALQEDFPLLNYAPQIAVRNNKEEDGTEALVGALKRSGDYIVVSIEDTGCGIPPEIFDRIFEPFFTTKDMNKGTGLGLSTVMGMIAAHQGALYLKSRVGKGSVFKAYFPEAVEAAIPGDAEAGALPGRNKEGGRILFVEDQEHVRKMMSEMIGRLGYEVDVCDSGDKAIDCIRENPGFYDLVLSDYMMPHMTGADMAAQIYRDFPDLPIVLISGYKGRKIEEIVEKGRGIQEVLSKPISSAALASALDRTIREKKLRRAS